MRKIDTISVSYAHLQVLLDINFEGRKGEIVSLIGSDGAGKTTRLSSEM